MEGGSKDVLWNKTQALDPKCIAGLLYSPSVVGFLKRTLKNKYKGKFSDEDVEGAITRLVTHSIKLEDIKPSRVKKERSKRVKAPIPPIVAIEALMAPPELIGSDSGDVSS